jgi:hypothetical protein
MMNAAAFRDKASASLELSHRLEPAIGDPHICVSQAPLSGLGGQWSLSCEGPE